MVLTILAETNLFLGSGLVDNLRLGVATTPVDTCLRGWFERIGAGLDWVSFNPLQSAQIINLSIKKSALVL